MRTVKIEPGICGFVATVKANKINSEGDTIYVEINSDCQAVNSINKELGFEFDAFETCLVKPGLDPFTQFASEKFPPHAACPVISGILKCIEVEAGLALPKDVKISFVNETEE